MPNMTDNRKSEHLIMTYDGPVIDDDDEDEDDNFAC